MVSADSENALALPPPIRAWARPAVFLDFDGTLVDIAAHPDKVMVADGLAAMLTALAARLDGRLAIVTGRSLEALGQLLGPIPCAAAGSHGGEFRRAGSTDIEPLADPLPLRVAQAMARFAQGHGGLLVEPKPFSIAVHYRHHPHARDALLAEASALAEAEGMALTHGKQVVELAMHGSDKGSAVVRFMGLPEFAGAQPIFAGDDVTDEDGFRAVSGFTDGGGVLIGPERPTAALWRLPGVAAVHQWLKEALT